MNASYEIDVNVRLSHLALVEVCEFGLNGELRRVTVLRAKDSSYVGKLYGAVRADSGGKQSALPLADLGHSLQQLVEPGSGIYKVFDVSI